MTTFDVHTDKAIKELRARLTEAERERDEARSDAAAFRRDFEAELSGARDIRKEHGARADETFRQFIGRIVRERDEARAARAATENEVARLRTMVRALGGQP